MTSAFGSLRGDGKQVFTEPVSPDLVRLGYGVGADDLITYIVIRDAE